MTILPQSKNNFIKNIAVLSVGVIAILAFVISYASLVDFVEQKGLPHPHLYPILIDGFLVVTIGVRLFVIQQKLGGEKPLGVLILLITIWGFVINAVEGWQKSGDYFGVAVFGSVTIILFLSSELLAKLFEKLSHKAKVQQTLAQIQNQILETKNDFAKTKSGLAKAKEALQNENIAISEAQAKLKAIQTQIKTENGQKSALQGRREQVLLLVNKGQTTADIAKKLKVSAQTVRNDIKQLNGAVQK